MRKLSDAVRKMASRFLLSAAARTLKLKDIYRMSDDEAFQAFQAFAAIRFAEKAWVASQALRTRARSMRPVRARAAWGRAARQESAAARARRSRWGPECGSVWTGSGMGGSGS